MKKTKYKVWFSNSNYHPEFESVSAFSQGDALILAQAKRIAAGKDKTLCKIEEV